MRNATMSGCWKCPRSGYFTRSARDSATDHWSEPGRRPYWWRSESLPPRRRSIIPGHFATNPKRSPCRDRPVLFRLGQAWNKRSIGAETRWRHSERLESARSSHSSPWCTPLIRRRHSPAGSLACPAVLAPSATSSKAAGALSWDNGPTVQAELTGILTSPRT